MGMVSPPSALEHFDFRAELGDIWVEPTDQPGPGLVTPTVDLTNALLGQLSSRHSPRNRPTPAPAPAPEVPEPAALPPQAPVLAAPSRPDMLPAVAPVLPHPVAHGGMSGTMDDTDFVLAPVGAIASADDAIFLEAGDSILLDDAERPSPPAPQPPSAAQTPLHNAASARQQQTDKKPASRTAAWLVAAVLGLSAVLGYGWIRQTPTAPAEDTMITEMAEPAPAPAAPPVASTPEPEIEEEVLAESKSPAVPDAPAPAFVEVSSKHPAAASAASAAAARRSAKASAAQERAAEAAPAAPVRAAAPAPKPRPEPAKALCSDTNFFTHSACVYSECAKPANAGLPMCIEHRRRVQKTEGLTGN